MTHNPRIVRGRTEAEARALGRARVAGGLVCAAVALAPGACKNAQAVGLEVEIPGDVASKVAWYEVGVFDSEVCGALGGTLEGGIPAEGYAARVAFQPGEPSPPVLGELARGQYAIAVAARAADCSVLATGCENIDFSQSTSPIDVVLTDTPSPAQGACTSGATCQDGECATDPASSVGAGCSLELVGAGPFADPLVPGGGGLASAPAIAASDDGFVIGYREFDPTAGTSRVTTIALDTGGGALAPVQTQQIACATAPVSDATGLVFTGKSGTLALSRGDCGSAGGIDLFSVSDTAAVTNDQLAGEGADVIALSTSHALATDGTNVFLAYVDNASARVAPVTANALGTPVSFGGSGPFSGAWVAATTKAIGLLALAPNGSNVAALARARVFSDDAGTDDAGEDASRGGSEDAGGSPPTFTGSTLLLNVAPAGSLGSLGTPIEIQGTWGSIAAQDGRVFVVNDGLQPDQPVVYQAFDLGSAGATVSNGFDTNSGSGAVLYADTALNQGHLFIAVERAGSIDLVAFDNATTTPTPLRDVSLGADPRIPSIDAVRDGLISVLATDTRVVVAWASAAQLGTNDATGAYAVFACTTP